MDSTANPARIDARVEPRKPYLPPRLTIYGDLRLVTLTGGTMGMNDMFGPDKSGF